MPKDPDTPARRTAIAWHECMLAFMEAGFTREEAFEMARTNYEVTISFGIVRSHSE